MRALATYAYPLDVAGNGEVKRHVRGNESMEGDGHQDVMMHPAKCNVAADGASLFSVCLTFEASSTKWPTG